MYEWKKIENLIFMNDFIKTKIDKKKANQMELVLIIRFHTPYH